MSTVAATKDSQLSAVAALVSQHDHDRFVTASFAPEGRRDSLFALFALNYELAKVREAVREPMMGRIRLQWWREAIDEIAAGNPPRQHEVAEPLAQVIRAHQLPTGMLLRMIDARENDLLPDPPLTLADLEDYADGTGGTLNALAFKTLGVKDIDGDAEMAARHVGVGYALAGLLRATAFHARFSRSYIPVEFDPDRHVLDSKPTPKLRDAAATIAEAAHVRLDKARALGQEAHDGALPVLLPAVLAERWLAQIENADYDLFSPRVMRPDPWRSVRLYFAARRGRI
jgi:NADH dehydrogenase [ubiquinone] 1 alpha subcomplex assembly factor 6